ncbi:hypothetical protein BMF94_5977 [Rhodotorula taiwanensis]|uniref:UDP-N-acetylglucosamine transferase subunit ALG13 n=1 Tax=Rhodotorula taiwanensis TaxID=741276 RepID=A0A2S5B2Y9_9BASI|nr:hypothetical protein BMF94_5977 [Rhodotorula taiwanensis]
MVKTCLLTVGSTRFDQLVSAFLLPDSLESLSDLGVNHVVAQVGNSLLPPGYHLGTTALPGGVRLEVFRFAGDLEEQVGNADLVVSHAGAGSLLSFIRPLSTSGGSSPGRAAHRKLVLVPNSTLMDSHQSDLAEEMDKKGWATICWTPEDLPPTLRGLGKGRDVQTGTAQSAFPELDKGKVQRILNEVLGYA